MNHEPKHQTIHLQQSPGVLCECVGRQMNLRYYKHIKTAIMNEQLRKEIISWAKSEMPSYIKECGTNEYRTYMREDAEAKFGENDQLLEAEVSDIVSAVINGDE